jgi:hypothetical protein
MCGPPLRPDIALASRGKSFFNQLLKHPDPTTFAGVSPGAG